MIALDPSQRVEVVLPLDAAKEPKPTFLARHVTAREWYRIRSLIDAAADSTTDAGLAPLLEALGIIIVGWRNIEAGDFAASRLDELLTISELWELLYAAQQAVVATELELKKSASRPQ